MMAGRPAARSRIRKIDRVFLALMLASFACAAIIEAFHGHSCADDGCMLCLAATVANALFATCASLTFALPVMRAVAAARLVHTLVRLVFGEVGELFVRPCSRVGLTPVTMGVKLLI